MKELHQLLIVWRRARATFGEALVKDPEMFDLAQLAALAVDETTVALFEWIDEYLPEWKTSASIPS